MHLSISLTLLCKSIALSILLFLFQSKLFCQVNKENSTASKIQNEFSIKINHQFARIDSLRFHDADSMDLENDRLEKIIEAYKVYLFDFPDTLDFDFLYVAKSADKQLILISWDTRMGGTMIEFATMAIFKTANGIKTLMIKDEESEEMQNTYMHYNEIHSINCADGTKIYLAWGNGQGSTSLPWQELRAFKIRNGELFQPRIFPKSSAAVSVTFDLKKFNDNERVPTIKVKDKGRKIEVPISRGDNSFPGKYRIYTFNGKTFVQTSK